jgi:autotransporter-associated beta strand protein
MNGSITLDGNANYKIDVYLQPTHWKINGGITRTGTNTGTLFLDLSHYQVTTPVRLTINSTIDNNGGAVTLFGNTAGILQMDAAGHDVGDFTVNGEQTATYQTILKLGINDALVTNKNLTLTKGTFDLAGFNQTVNALSGVVNVSSITNSSASASTLTVGNGGGTSTYAGTISSGSGTLKLVKSGAGTITLTGANSYNENSVEGGILVIGNVNQGTGSQANNIASGATLRLTSGNGFTSDMSFAGAGTLELNGPIFTWGAKVGTFAMDSESLIKVTSGTFWTNSGAGAEIWTNNKSDLDIASGAIVNVITGETRVDSLTGSGTVEGGFGATGSLLTVGVDNGSGTFSGTVTNYANAGAAGHIAKEGSGTQVLSGTLSYSGDTTVKGGTLTLKQINTSNESSTVTIAAGAKLGLDFEGSDTVDKLFLGTPAVQISPGTYSASHPTYGSYFENGGSLIVTNGPEAPVAGFSSWISGTFANGTVDAGQQGANDDPDGDGISNLLEYAVLDQDPTVANPSVGTLTGKTLSFSKRADASGLTYEIEKSSDLGISDPWTVVTPTVNDASTISYTLPDGPAKNFQRLKITQE